MTRILKNANERIVAADQIRAHRTAETILTNAKAQAANILQAAQDESEAITAERNETALAEAKAHLALAWLSVEKARKDALHEATESATTIAFAVAKALTLDTFQNDPNAIRRLVTEAIRPVVQAERAQLFVHSCHAKTFDDLDINVRIDDDLGPADCRLETELGEVRSHLHIRLDNLLNTFRRAQDDD